MGNDRIPKPGMMYEHFKGKLCQIIAVATHSETGEKMVVYQNLYDDFSIYVEPYDVFISEDDRTLDGDAEVDAHMESNEEIGECNPDLLAFLEADTYEEKRNILVDIRKRIDDRLINDIAASLDITVDDGELETRYRSLMNCIDTMKRFECDRLR